MFEVFKAAEEDASEVSNAEVAEEFEVELVVGGEIPVAHCFHCAFIFHFVVEAFGLRILVLIFLKTLEEVEEDLNGFFPNMLPDLSAFFMDKGIDDFHKENDKYGEDVISHLHSILKHCMLKNGNWETEYFCEICRSIFSLIVTELVVAREESDNSWYFIFDHRMFEVFKAAEEDASEVSNAEVAEEFEVELVVGEEIPVAHCFHYAFIFHFVVEAFGLRILKTLEEVEEDLNGFFPNMLPDLSAFFMDQGIDDFHKENDKYGEDVISRLHSILKHCMLKNGYWDTEYFCEICRSIFSLIVSQDPVVDNSKSLFSFFQSYIVFTGDFIKEYAYNPEADVSKLVRAIIDKLENPQEFNYLLKYVPSSYQPRMHGRDSRGAAPVYQLKELLANPKDIREKDQSNFLGIKLCERPKS
nr:hypothetical protein CFP56_41862 [Quercus suber]